MYSKPISDKRLKNNSGKKPGLKCWDFIGCALLCNGAPQPISSHMVTTRNPTALPFQETLWLQMGLAELLRKVVTSSGLAVCGPVLTTGPGRVELCISGKPGNSECIGMGVTYVGVCIIGNILEM